jgi:general secretion pathway protein D
MKRSLLLLLPSRGCLGRLFLSLLLLFPSGVAWATNEVTLTFENTDIRTVIKKVGELSRTTFLFDPEQVQGKITLLAPQKVSPEEALRLLQSALALHGYRMVKKEEGAWILPVEKAVQTETSIEVVPLKYAKAEEVAYTLSYIAPPGVYIAPYSPTNSLIISGDPEAVAELIGILKEKKEESRGK